MVILTSYKKKKLYQRHHNFLNSIYFHLIQRKKLKEKINTCVVARVHDYCYVIRKLLALPYFVLPHDGQTEIIFYRYNRGVIRLKRKDLYRSVIFVNNFSHPLNYQLRFYWIYSSFNVFFITFRIQVISRKLSETTHGFQRSHLCTICRLKCFCYYYWSLFKYSLWKWNCDITWVL